MIHFVFFASSPCFAPILCIDQLCSFLSKRFFQVISRSSFDTTSEVTSLATCIMFSISKKFITSVIKPTVFPTRNFGRSSFAAAGFDDFKDKTDEVMTAGRAWTATDLRKKVCPGYICGFVSRLCLILSRFQSFNDLHALWWVLYKERNLLLTARHAHRQRLVPLPILEENRYIRVKRSMAAIKVVLNERKRIQTLLKETAKAKAPKSESA